MSFDVNTEAITHKGLTGSYKPESYDAPMDEISSEITDLCKKLNQKSSDGAFDCQAWIDDLERYTKDISNRLIYSKISDYIFEKGEQESATFLSNISSVMIYAASEIRPQSEKQNLYKTIVKFYDHVNLAIKQQAMFGNKIEDLRQQISSELDPKISGATKDLTSQLIGLVALFTALSFIVFGGISSLDNLLSYLNAQESVLPSLIIAVAWAFCLMNLLFGFMYFVLRVAKLSPSEEKEKNLIQQYPIVFLCNYVLLLLFAVFCGMWFAVRNGIGRPIFECAVNHSIWTFFIAIAVFLIAFLCLGRKLWKLYKAP